MIGRNRKRTAEAYARNYGGEADIIRAMPCLVKGCRRASQAAHVVPKSAARGGRFDQAPLCELHHAEAGEGRSDGRPTSIRTAFEKRHGLDLREIADRIAVEHEPPLGLRYLARQFVILSGSPHAPASSSYEQAALFGWSRRWADRSRVGFIAGTKAACHPGDEPSDDEATSHSCASVARALRIDLADAVTLLEAAGWAPGVGR